MRTCLTNRSFFFFYIVNSSTIPINLFVFRFPRTSHRFVLVLIDIMTQPAVEFFFQPFKPHGACK